MVHRVLVPLEEPPGAGALDEDDRSCRSLRTGERCLDRRSLPRRAKDDAHACGLRLSRARLRLPPRRIPGSRAPLEDATPHEAAGLFFHSRQARQARLKRLRLTKDFCVPAEVVESTAWRLARSTASLS